MRDSALGTMTKMHHKVSVLIVEDEPRYLESTRLLLSRYVHSIDAVATGQQALDLLAARSFDIVLLDLSLPDMTGHDVMTVLRAKWPETIIIVISGDTCIDSAIRALRLGAYDYLSKPYEPEELINTIRNTTHKLHLTSENRHFQQALQHSEYLHRLLVNSSPDIIYTLDTEGRFTFLNDSAKRILDLDTDALIGLPYEKLVVLGDRDLARYNMNDRRTGTRSTQNFELRLKRGPFEDDLSEDYVTVELNAMGLYRAAADGSREFIGSYGVARDITERKQAEATITFQAYHDLLTGLPNRALFKDRLGQAIVQCKRQGSSLAIMFLDLDHFKVVNDTLGHLIGDELLQAVGQRLRGCLREGDTLARIGGDEFLLLLPQVQSRESVAGIAQKITAALKLPFLIESHELFVSISIGIAIYPDDGEMIDILIKNADIAMYHAKDQGRDGYTFFAKEFDRTLTGRLDTQTGLRHALQRQEFELYYQPQVSISTGKIVGMEALIRWHHPERGLVQPADFISVAENCGLICPIGDWVLNMVCQQAKSWLAQTHQKVTLSINLSARQIEHPLFVQNFIRMLDENQLPGDCLEIEITESTLMRDMESCIAKLKQLSEHGVGVSIDDFGTGYSSLSYLRRLPVNTLKIDQSFIGDLKTVARGVAIVDGITAMAKGLNLSVVAEGVESVEQLDYLRAIGCNTYQGFLFSRPVCSAQATTLLLQTQPC